MSDITTKTATKGAVKLTAPSAPPRGGKKTVIQAAASALEDESDEENSDEEVTEEKPAEERPFSELSQAERNEIHKARADELTTDPIYEIRFEPYRAAAEERGAVKFSTESDCHFYQFKGKKDADFFLWAFVRFGSPVKKEVAQQSDRQAKRRALRNAAKDAGIYQDILDEIRKASPAPKPKGAGRNEIGRSAPKRRNNNGAPNLSWQRNNYGAPNDPRHSNTYISLPRGGGGGGFWKRG